MTKRGCGTCKHLEVRPDKDGAIRIRSENAYWCKATIPVVTNMPDSVTTAAGWRDIGLSQKRYMCPGDGTSCPSWEARK